MIVYDVTNAESLRIAGEWIESVRQTAPASCSIYLVGNKTDLIENIEVSNK